MTYKGDAGAGWLRLGVAVLMLAALAAQPLNRRLPKGRSPGAGAPKSACGR